MIRLDRTLISVGFIGAMALAACSGQNNSVPSTVSNLGVATNAAPAPVTANDNLVPEAVAATSVLKTAMLEGSLGFVARNGHTAYVFDADLVKPNASQCNGACATTWPPIRPAGATLSGLWGSFTRTDGTKQLTFNTRALYKYSGDTAAGQTNGDGLVAFGGTWHVARPTTTVAPTTSPTSSGALGFVYAPFEYTGDFQPSSNVITTQVLGKSQSALSAMPAAQTAMTWAFADGTCGSETFSGLPPAAFAAANVPAWASAGKKYIISTGGAGASFLCPTSAGFLQFIKTYYSSSMIGVDFDIENNQTQAQINALVQDCVAATATYPHMRWSFTVGTEAPTDGTDPIGGAGDQVLSAIKQFGLKNYTIDIMAMDYANVGGANSDLCVVVNHVCEMGQSAVQAAEDVHNKHALPYSVIEVTVLPGGNDSSDEVFTIADVATLSTFSKANGLAGIRWWEFNRDRDCAPNTGNQGSSDTCNNYGKAGTLGFTNAFISDLGL